MQSTAAATRQPTGACVSYRTWPAAAPGHNSVTACTCIGVAWFEVDRADVLAAKRTAMTSAGASFAASIGELYAANR